MAEDNMTTGGQEGEPAAFSFFGKLGRELWEIVNVLVISLAIVLPIRYFIVQPFIVRGGSMEPNFEDKEYLVVDELSYRFRAPARGEVIIFRYPRDPSQFFIKRVMGLSGEKVVIKDGRIHIINSDHPKGFLVDEPYLLPPNRKTYPDMEVSVPQEKLFVLGDNRDFSSDSRIWGLLPANLVIGHAFFRVWPVERLGVIPEIKFSLQ